MCLRPCRAQAQVKACGTITDFCTRQVFVHVTQETPQKWSLDFCAFLWVIFFLLFFDCNLDTQTHRYTEPMQAALLQGLQTTFDLTDTRVGNFFCLLKRLVNTFFTLAFSLCFIRACFRNLKKVSTRHQAWAVSIFSYLPDITQRVFLMAHSGLCAAFVRLSLYTTTVYCKWNIIKICDWSADF